MKLAPNIEDQQGLFQADEFQEEMALKRNKDEEGAWDRHLDQLFFKKDTRSVPQVLVDRIRDVKDTTRYLGQLKSVKFPDTPLTNLDTSLKVLVLKAIRRVVMLKRDLTAQHVEYDNLHQILPERVAQVIKTTAEIKESSEKLRERIKVLSLIERIKNNYIYQKQKMLSRREKEIAQDGFREDAEKLLQKLAEEKV